MVSDTVQDVNQVLHNVGMAAWVGVRASGVWLSTRR
jgi:putative copper export protein